jgi:hypothetical protein
MLGCGNEKVKMTLCLTKCHRMVYPSYIRSRPFASISSHKIKCFIIRSYWTNACDKTLPTKRKHNWYEMIIFWCHRHRFQMFAVLISQVTMVIWWYKWQWWSGDTMLLQETTPRMENTQQWVNMQCHLWASDVINLDIRVSCWMWSAQILTLNTIAISAEYPLSGGLGNLLEVIWMGCNTYSSGDWFY